MRFSVLFLLISLLRLAHGPHPGSHRLARPALKGIAEGVVASVTTLAGQLLGGDGASGSMCLVIEIDEVIDSQIVDISIVVHALTGEILAEIEAIGSNSLGQLYKGEVVLQIELRVYAILL